MLPQIFARFSFLGIAPLLESLLIGTAFLMFAAYYRRQRPRFFSSLKQAGRQYPKLVLVWVINTVLVYLLFETLPTLFQDFALLSPRRQLVISLGLQVFSILLSALFVYVIPFLLIAGRSLGGSFLGSFSLFFKNLVSTYFLVMIPQLPLIALGLLLQNYGGDIVEKFHPRVMVGFSYLHVLCLVGSNFFIVGTICRFFLATTEE
jgi:hypothetical protein